MLHHHFSFLQSALLCLSADSKINEADIDEVLVSIPEFFMPLAVDRTSKGVAQAMGGKKEKGQEESEEAAMAADPLSPPTGPSFDASGQSFPSDRKL